MKPTYLPLVRLQCQRHEGDCTVAVLAMLAGVSYEDALLAMGGEEPKVLRGGAWFPQIIRAADRLGLALSIRRSYDLEADEGILQIRHVPGPHHVVLLREGLLFDTDFSVWEPTDYFRAKRCKPGPLLVKAE